MTLLAAACILNSAAIVIICVWLGGAGRLQAIRNAEFEDRLARLERLDRIGRGRAL